MDNKSTSALQQQSSCDNNNVCDDHNKMSNSQPSWLSSQLSSLSVLLPSNFLNLPPRWRDWFIRGQSGIFLISCFFILISLGPLGLFSLTLIVQVREGLTRKKKSVNFPTFGPDPPPLKSVKLKKFFFSDTIAETYFGKKNLFFHLWT